MTGSTRTPATVRRGALCLGMAGLLTWSGTSAALAADSLQVTPGGATLLNMAPGEIRTMTTDIYNPTARDAQVATVASVDGEIGSAAGHILLTVDSCSVPWTDVTPAGAPDADADINRLVLTCAGGEEEVLSDWAVMGTTYADSSFRVDSGTTTYLRTQVRLGDGAPQAMQGVHGSLSYSFASVEAPPKIPDDVEPTPAPTTPTTVPSGTSEPAAVSEPTPFGIVVSGEQVAAAVDPWLLGGAGIALAAAAVAVTALVRRRRRGAIASTTSNT